MSLPSGNAMVSLNRPPSQIVLSLPGIPHSQFFRSKTPSFVRAGFAKKPKGWSRRHCFLCQRVSTAAPKYQAAWS